MDSTSVSSDKNRCHICIKKFNSALVFPSKRILELHMLSHKGEIIKSEGEEPVKTATKEEEVQSDATGGNNVKQKKNQKKITKTKISNKVEVNMKSTSGVLKNSVSCVYCDKMMDNPEALKVHKQTEHSNEIIEINTSVKTESIISQNVKMEPEDDEETSINDNSGLSDSDIKIEAIKSTSILKEEINEGESHSKRPNRIGLTYKKAKVEKVCPHCFKEFSIMSNMKIHIKRVHFPETVERLACEQCPKTFKSTTNLKEHMRKHTGEKPYLCDSCPKSFPTSSAARSHRKVHTGEKPYCCEECGKQFSQSGALKLHKYRHLSPEERPKPFLCQDCPKTFSQWGNLITHKRTHTGEKPLLCSFCSKTFAHRNALKIHIRRHTGETPYMCSDCPMKFKSQNELARHFLSHTGVKNYQCEHCQNYFSRQSHLRQHIAATHEGVRHHCDKCDFKSTQKWFLNKHMKQHHGTKEEKNETMDIINLGPNTYNNEVSANAFETNERLQNQNEINRETFKELHHFIPKVETVNPWLPPQTHQGPPAVTGLGLAKSMNQEPSSKMNPGYSSEMNSDQTIEKMNLEYSNVMNQVF